MDLDLVTVGTELLLGFTIDSNAADIAQAVSAAGGRVVRRVSVADEEAAIRDAVADGLRQSGFVVVTGGLGPTKDDVTKRAVAGLLDRPLELDEAYVRALEERFARYRRGPLPPSNRSQAEIPRGALVWPNRRGTAAGLVFEDDAGTVVLLPGVPLEMRAMLEEYLLPMVRERVQAATGSARVTRSVTLRTTGITESGLASLLEVQEQALERVSIAYLPGFEGVDLRLTAWNLPEAEAEAVLRRAAASLLPVMGGYCYGTGETDLAAVVLDQLRERGQTLAVAESCTGGRVGSRLTAISGASEVFAGAVTAYSDRVKMEVLGVSTALIRDHGAVSEEVAREMARGARRWLDTDASIAVTGVAGPGGGSQEKPVGTVWLAGSAGERECAILRRFPGDRHEVQARSAQAALDLLRYVLLDLPL